MSSWSPTASPCSTTARTATRPAVPTSADAPFDAMQDIRLAASFFSNGGGAMPVDSNGLPWNGTFVTSTGNVIMDMLFNFHLECGARIHKLRVYETMTEATGREVCGYLLVRGSVHAHAYALVLKKLTGVAIEKMLPVPNIDLDTHPGVPEVPGRGPASLALHEQPGRLQGDGRHLGQRRDGAAGRPARASSRSSRACRTAARCPTSTAWPRPSRREYAPEEMFEIANKLYKASR